MVQTKKHLGTQFDAFKINLNIIYNMKTHYLFAIALFTYTLTYSQGVGINEDGSSPMDGAMLDIKSTSQGILIPRMTVAQRNAITVKPNSLLIYQTDQDTGFYYYDENTTTWYPFLSGGNGPNAGWKLHGNGGTNPNNHFIGTIDSTDWVIKTDNTEHMRIMSNGNIGIGISSPSNKFYVFDNTVSSTLYPTVENISATSWSGWRVKNDQGSIGNSYLGGSATAASSYPDAYNIWTDAPNGIVIRNADTNNIRFVNNGSEHMRIEGSSGNIGIGTNAPTAHLDVTSGGNGAADYTARFLSSTSVAGSGGTIFSNSTAVGSTGFKIHTTATGPGTYTNDALNFSNITYSTGVVNQANLFVIKGDGNIGIGTAGPNALVELSVPSAAVNGTKGLKIINQSGTVVVLENGVSNDSYVGTTSSSKFHVRTNNLNRLSISQGGNIGIGTTTPGQKLDIISGNGRVQSGFNWLTNSDRRYKKNITSLQNSLSKILAIRGVRYDLKDDNNIKQNYGKHIGFIAQELEKEFPEFVVTEENGYKSVSYDKMTAVLVNAIKEQQQIIESQSNQLKNQTNKLEDFQKINEKELADLKAEIKELKAIINQVSKR